MSAALVLMLAALAPAQADVPAVAPVRHRVHAAGSSARFQVRLRTLRRVEGRFERLEGTVLPDAAGDLQVRVRVEADGVVFPGRPGYTQWARSEAFFDAARHPHIVFESQRFAPALLVTGGDLDGRLLLRGTSRPVRFRVAPAACAAPGIDCPLEVRGEVSRSAFGMNALQMAVADRVRFAFSLRLEPSS
ncbi:YceI family protein [Coralloluteibacterium thermophilus]|uniref:YceI family protein n=1 Tax=Coralloluteibacterium thermophilum TaxID=2707049 RepID=A0ABV9NHN3_9GAMM